MTHKLIARSGAFAAAAATAALAMLGTAGPASASQFIGTTLHPGEQRCVQQYAAYRVRFFATATGQGAKFKLQYNRMTVPGTGSPGIVTRWQVDLPNPFAPFPGPGFYTACATNNGTANTNVQLTLLTDGEGG